jgi:hypothetical protein
MENVRLLSAAGRYLSHPVEMLVLASGDAPWRREFCGVVHEVGAGCAKGAAAREFMGWLREHAGGYDCVLISGVSGCEAYGVWKALRDAGVPYFVFTPRYLGFLTGVSRQVEKAGQRFCWPWAGYPLLRDAHAAFFAGEEARREARGCFWPYDCHEFVLFCGVPDGRAGRGAAPGAGFLDAHPELAGKRVFSVLAPGPGPAPEALLRAVRNLVGTGRWDCDSMRLLLAGFDGEKSAEALRRSLARHGLEGVVQGIGTLTAPERWSVLQASEALVQPARAEHSGQAVAEALSAGKPVLIAKGLNLWREVVSHSAGLAEDDTTAGYTALFNDWLRESPEDRAAYGANARSYFEEHHTEQAGANMLMAVIYLLLGARQSGNGPVDPEIFRQEADFL